ncbi:PHP domain-containing protein [candidate division KSB1 bacterium]|nr:PHP domain-containing protein [candidate division KSB1 bacterium]
MRWYKADLHIHTVLSPCAELSMGPKDIVQKALTCELDMIAITDHNSAQNIAGVMQAARDTNLTVIPGMEVYSREEAHMICLFETVEHAAHFQDVIYEHLPKGKNDPDWFGNQYVVDGDENIVEECPKLLAMPTNLHVHEIVSFVIDLGGIVYPAHIDRRSNSMLSALGFIPSNYPLDALEIALPLESALQRHDFLKSSPFSLIRSSDAHMIEQLGSKVTWFYLQAPTVAELKKAMKRQDGRRTSLANG